MTGGGGGSEAERGFPDSSPAQLHVPMDQKSPESPKYFIKSVEPGIYVVDPTPNNTYMESKASLNTSTTENDTERSVKSSSTGLSKASSADRTQIYGVDENEDRGNWTGRLDFLLAMLGYAVGLGNIWRFPYLCYRNGGGAFLVPYLLFMSVVGIPLFFMEACLGQFTSCGPTTCWEFAPLFKGLGMAMIVVSGITSLYYNMIIAWCQFYFFASFTSTLPWSDCDNEWNTQDCSFKLPSVDCVDGTKYTNGTCYQDDQFQGIWNETLFTLSTGRKRISPSEEYWNNFVLGISSGIDEMGAPRWQLVLSLMLAWLLCCLCLIKGIKSTGKVVYFTATFPYVILLILFFRGVTLENAGEGIKFYILPKFERLGDAKVWRDAAMQIFYSMGPAWGGIIVLASYNRFHNNILRDSLIVSIGNCMTSIFGGFVIFSYIGYMAGQLKVEVDKVANSGAGLAFVVYPEAVMRLPLPTLWSLLFFFMLITLGLDSEFTTIEILLTGAMDYWPEWRKWKSLLICIICATFFLLGLTMTCPGGVYMLQILDHYAAGWPLLLIGLIELLALTYAYGWRRFFLDIEVMTGRRPSYFWPVCWCVISPLGIVFILFFAFFDYTAVKYGDYEYPGWADGLGWLISLTSVVFIPGTMVYQIYREDEEDTILKKIRLLLSPSRFWGPSLVKHRELIDYVDGFVLDPVTEKKELSYINRGYDGKSMSDIQINGSVASLSVSGRSYISKSTVLSQASNVTYESTI